MVPDSFHPFLAGVVGGSVGLVVGYPLDTIRIRMQLQSSFPSAMHCFRSTIANEGYRALYRGIYSPLPMVAFQKAISFGTYASVLEIIRPRMSNDLYAKFFAGALTGVANGIVSLPIDQIKIRFQNAQTATSLESSLSLKGTLMQGLNLARTEGFLSLYRGWQLSCIKDVVGYTMYFVIYDKMRALSDSVVGKENRSFNSWISGGLTGMIGWFIVYPVDVLKSRIQAQPDLPTGSVSKPTLASIARTFYPPSSASLARLALYRGIGPTLLRAFVGHSTLFLGYETTMAMLKGVM
eukprot:ANDGO_02846.mRNA.1 Mitochondrial substrate carrier family protein S